MTHADDLAGYFMPGTYNSLSPTSDSDLRWHGQLEVMRQGTRWYAAGLASTPEQHLAIAEAERAIYPQGRVMTQIRTWLVADDPDTAFIEWRDAGETWRGQTTSNGGMSVFEFDDGMVRRVREFTNTSYLETVEDGWIHLLPDDTLLNIPAYHSIELPSEAWKPFPPASKSKLMIQPAVDWGDRELTAAERIARFYEPARLLKDAMHDHWHHADGGYMEFQGTKWRFAGRNRGSAQHAIGKVHAGIFSGTIAFSHLAVWDCEDEPNFAMHEWVSRGTLWTGRKFANHGLTVIEFDDQGGLLAHREYLNVAYLEAVMDGWRQFLTDEEFTALQCSVSFERASDAWSPIPLGDVFEAAPAKGN